MSRPANLVAFEPVAHQGEEAWAYETYVRFWRQFNVEAIEILRHHVASESRQALELLDRYRLQRP